MLRMLQNIYHLGVKELISLRYDKVLVVLIVYAFTLSVYLPAQNSGLELRNASVAVVDEDRSQLSARIAGAFLQPYFQKPEHLTFAEIDRAMETGRHTFVVDIPPKFQADVLAGHNPAVQVNVDATAMSHAGIGASYIQNILSLEITRFLQTRFTAPVPPVQTAVRVLYNPNLKSKWFYAVMQITHMIIVISIVLTAAALIREREHGTIDHLLVMPLRPIEIVLAKVWSSGLVIVIASLLSLRFVVMGILDVPVAGSIPLFVAGVVIYMFSLAAIGIFLATVARTMPQLGLLFIPVVDIMIVLSGGFTPLDNMPPAIQFIMQAAPSTHFVKIASAILFRGAGFDTVWSWFAAVAGIGAAFFAGALIRFRKTLAMVRS